MSQWKWCATDNNGKVIKGWYQDNDVWYHLNSETGTLETGWFQDTDKKWYYLDEKNGDLKTGWIQLKGIWYYLEPSSTGYMGACYVDCTATIDGKEYTFDANGHMINNSLVSDNCIAFVKRYEGFSATKYDDGTGVITQGYGCIGKEIADWGEEITEEVAATRLKELINSNYAAIIKTDLDNRGVTLKQNEFDSIVSMAYNIGTGGLLGSTLYRNIVSGVRGESLKPNFTTWSKAGGSTMQGLLNRRIEEYNMFANSDYTRNL